MSQEPEDEFFKAVNQIISNTSNRRKPKVFESTQQLLDDISDSTTNSSSSMTSPSQMRARYNNILNSYNIENPNNNSNSNFVPSSHIAEPDNIPPPINIQQPSTDTSTTSTMNSTFVIVNASDLESSTTQSVQPRQCCSNPEEYHKYTLAPAERQELIQYHAHKTIPAKYASPQQRQNFETKANRFYIRPIANDDGSESVGIYRRKTQHKLRSNNKVISHKKAAALQESEYYTNVFELIVPKCCDIMDIFTNHHILGHIKQNKLLNELNDAYWFKNLKKFIKYALSQCETCTKVDNTVAYTYTAPMKPLKIAVQPYDCVSIDLLGPLPESLWGNKYVIIAVDRLTGHVEAEPLPSKDSEVVAYWLLKGVWKRYGYTYIKVNDNGGEFSNGLNTAVCKMLNIEQRLITPYHPQGNGKTEIMVKTYKTALKHNIAEDRGDYKNLSKEECDLLINDDNGMFDWGRTWDQTAHEMSVMTIDLHPRTSTTYAPITELTGRVPCVHPSELKRQVEHKEGDDFYDPKFIEPTQLSVEERIKGLQVFRAQMKVSIQRARAAMKAKFDKKRGLVQQLKVHDKVVYRNSKSSRSNNVKANQVWLPRSGYGVIRHITDGGRCQIEIFNALHQQQRTIYVMIQNLKKYAIKPLSGRKRPRDEVDDDSDDDIVQDMVKPTPNGQYIGSGQHVDNMSYWNNNDNNKNI